MYIAGNIKFYKFRGRENSNLTFPEQKNYISVTYAHPKIEGKSTTEEDNYSSLISPIENICLGLPAGEVLMNIFPSIDQVLRIFLVFSFLYS